MDHFTFVFDKPVKVKSIAVVTGRPDGSDSLDHGKLLVSANGKAFHERAEFAQGKSQAKLKDESIIAVRIQPEAKSDHHLAIREVTIESDPPVAVYKYPVEFVIDVADEPKMKDWAENVAQNLHAGISHDQRRAQERRIQAPVGRDTHDEGRLPRGRFCLGRTDHRLGQVF